MCSSDRPYFSFSYLLLRTLSHKIDVTANYHGVIPSPTGWR